VPENEIVSGEFEALLVIATLPVTLPDAAGANITFIVADPPGLRMSPVEIPFTLKPAPEIVTFEMETLEPPVFVSVTDCILLLPTFTFPKLTVEAPALS
jgi:hypothetical protein